jgi:hypothetical protein
MPFSRCSELYCRPRPHGRALNDERAGQSVKHVFWIVPLFGQPPRVHEPFVDGVPQLVGAKLVKLGAQPPFDPKSLAIGQAADDNLFLEICARSDGLYQSPVHAWIQLRCPGSAASG